MPTFTVESVQGEPREWQSQYGPMLSYTLAVSGQEGVVELSQKPDRPAPKAGDSIEGEIVPSNGNFPPKLKRARQGGGNFSGGGMSPEREKRITRLHSQEMAIRLAGAMGWTTELDLVANDAEAVGAFLNGPLKRLIDWFDKDAGV